MNAAEGAVVFFDEAEMISSEHAVALDVSSLKKVGSLSIKVNTACLVAASPDERFDNALTISPSDWPLVMMVLSSDSRSANSGGSWAKEALNALQEYVISLPRSSVALRSSFSRSSVVTFAFFQAAISFCVVSILSQSCLVREESVD